MTPDAGSGVPDCSQGNKEDDEDFKTEDEEDELNIDCEYESSKAMEGSGEETGVVDMFRYELHPWSILPLRRS